MQSNEELNTLFESTKFELSAVKKSVEVLELENTLSIDYYNSCKQSEESHIFLLKIGEKLSTVLEIAREFNKQIFLNTINCTGVSCDSNKDALPVARCETQSRAPSTQENKCNTIDTNLQVDSNENQSSNSQELCVQSNTDGLHTNTQMMLTPQNEVNKTSLNSSYEPQMVAAKPSNTLGVILHAEVTAIKSKLHRSFYVILPEILNTIGVILPEDKLKDCKKYTQLPPNDVVFGLATNGVVSRAKRYVCADCKPDESSRPERYVQLIDVGIVRKIKPDAVMYELSQKVVSLPCQTMLCILDPDAGQKLEEEWLKLRKHLLKSTATDFQIRQKINDIFYVKMLHNDVGATGRVKNGFKKKKTAVDVKLKHQIKLFDPFQQQQQIMNLEILNSAKAVVDVELKHKIKLFDPFEHNIKKIPSSADVPALKRKPKDNFEVQRLRDILFEDEPTTTNILKAVYGYEPNDDKRICRYFDAKTGGCFKGSKCKLEHMPFAPDGWTKDQVLMSTSSLARFIGNDYVKGKIISIIPTHIDKLDSFYACDTEKLKKCTQISWKSEELPKIQLLSKPPMIFDVVLTKYNDGLWYRAEVINTDDQQKYVTVFFIDYGNTMSTNYRNLAVCDAMTAAFPRQAIYFRLLNVHDIANETEQRELGLVLLNNALLEEQVLVRYEGYTEDPVISFMDAKHKRLLLQLQELKFLKSCEMQLSA